jgi:hypothetical protein
VTHGRRGAAARLTLAAACLLASAGTGRAQVTLEYIAHAAFVIEADGTRLVIDPYNGARWLGYEFPEGVEADAVAITHPHYDHDAGYYLAGTQRSGSLGATASARSRSSACRADTPIPTAVSLAS